MKNTPVYSVVAFSGTGKTTFLEKLIPELKSRGLRVAVIKHDAHEFEIDREGKDSYRMTKAGADVTVVTSATKAAIMENRPVTVEELISRLTGVDLVLTEGYKHGPWPKIALFRNEVNKPFPIPYEECLAIASNVPIDTDRPCFTLEDVTQIADIIVKDMYENLNSSHS